MILRISRLLVGAGLACGVLCVLPLLLTALGVSGAAALAATAQELDELLFCSPLALRLGALVLACVAIGYGVRRYRARKACASCDTRRP